MKNRRYSAFLFAFFLCYIFYRIYWQGNADMNIYDYFTLLFGTVNFANQDSFLWNIGLWMIPQLLVISICSDFFETNLMSNVSIIFTRTNARKKIVVKYSFLLGIKTVIIVCIEMLSSIIIGGMFGISFSGTILKLFLEILNVMGYMIALALMINILSLFMNISYALLAVFFIECLELFIVKDNIIIGNLLPVSGVLQEIRNTGTNLQSIGVLFYMIILIFVLICVGAYTCGKKKDLL